MTLLLIFPLEGKGVRKEGAPCVEVPPITMYPGAERWFFGPDKQRVGGVTSTESGGRVFDGHGNLIEQLIPEGKLSEYKFPMGEVVRAIPMSALS